MDKQYMKHEKKTYFLSTIVKNYFIRWTRPPEEGERTDNEDHDEEGEEIPDEERREVEPSSHRD